MAGGIINLSVLLVVLASSVMAEVRYFTTRVTTDDPWTDKHTDNLGKVFDFSDQ